VQWLNLKRTPQGRCHWGVIKNSPVNTSQGDILVVFKKLQGLATAFKGAIILKAVKNNSSITSVSY